LSTFSSFNNTLSIKGVGVQILLYDSPGVPPTVPFASQAWGKMIGGQVAYTVLLSIKNTGTEKLALSFNNTLPAAVGVVQWQIEKYVSGAWVWQNMDGTFGSSNPLLSGQYIGYRPGGTPVEGSYGNIRVSLTIASNPPFGDVAPFDVFCYGVEEP
jgi:hypothetical protein